MQEARIRKIHSEKCRFFIGEPGIFIWKKILTEFVRTISWILLGSIQTVIDNRFYRALIFIIMKIGAFVKFVNENPALLDMEIGVVLRTEKIIGGQLDGGVNVHFNPVQSVTLFGDGVLFWADRKVEKKQPFYRGLAKFPAPILGTLPDDLNW